MSKYQEMVLELEMFQDGDQVLGSDGEWHDMHLTPMQISDHGYRLHFQGGGYLDCSWDHLWTLFQQDGKPMDVSAELLWHDQTLWDLHVGAPDGPLLEKMEELDSSPVLCLEVDTPDHLFVALDSQGNEVLVHNCQFRSVCGRLNTTASIMATGSAIATGIDGNHKGAGMLVSNGNATNLQYYYEETDWLTEWFRKRGMDEKGWAPEDLEEQDAQDEDLESLEGEEEITLSSKTMDIDFMDQHVEVDSSMDQHFEEV